MSEYPNSGTLSKNDNPKSEKSPPYRGKAEVAGVEYWVSAWVKEGKYGKFFSLSFQPKEEPAHQKPEIDPEFDQEIPF